MLDVENRFYVYIHANKDGSVVYVGKGTGTRAWKFKERSKRWMKEFSNEKPEVTIVKDHLLEDEAFSLEMETVIDLKNLGIHVLNVELDRRGDSRHWTPELRAIFSEKMRGANAPWFGKKRDPELMRKLVEASHTPEAITKSKATRALGDYGWTDERRERLSEIMTGRIVTPEHAANISKAKKGIPSGRKGEKFSEEHKRKISEACKGRVYGEDVRRKALDTWKARGGTIAKAKKVRCIDTGEVFRSCKEAAEAKTDGKGIKVIQQCCVGAKKSYKGLHWEHVKEA